MPTTTDGTVIAAMMVGRSRGGRDEAGGRGQHGLMTLDWLLVVGTVAALAAVTAYVVQRVVEDKVHDVKDPVVLMLAAEVAAALVVEEAYEAAVREAMANPSFRPDDAAFVAPFRLRCEGLATARRFGAVLLGAALVVSPAAERPFRCELTFRNPDS